ncbi:MAG TPA: hypothetical protein PKH92_07905 [Anaerolineaceae bacterium]|nr:hypothetical protein [Anaerolineaceae bacterium]HQF61063.1 hypothetical protein [Anaerolineaceae bacterium]HQH85403.1 hypothetical protein [Anaerolineaceae bacterium]
MKPGNLKPTFLSFNIPWLIVFLISTPIVLMLAGKNTTIFYKKLDAGYNGRAGVNWFYQMDNLTHDVELDGWAFAETERDNPHKSVKLLFVSDELSYEVDTEVYDEAWTKNFYTDLNVPDARNGYYAKFSPLGMKNGDYSLFMKVVENEYASGTFYSYSDFRKTNDEFIRLENGIEVTDLDFSNVTTSNAVKWYVDVCEIREDKLYISGWTLHKRQHSLSNRVYLEIIKPDGTIVYFSTSRVFRKGVGELFGNNKFNMAGFWVEIPLDSLGEGENHISMMIGTKYRAPIDYQINIIKITQK